MNYLFEAALEIQSFLEKREWPYYFIGALAVLRWGEIRTTQDVDLTVFVGFGNEHDCIQAFLDKFESRIPDAVDFALKHRVMMLKASNKTPVDVSLGGLPFENEIATRASSYAFSDECSLFTCSAEDLIVLKAVADRTKDWVDIEGILIRQNTQLDFDYILDRLTPLCELKEAPYIIERLTKLIDETK
ncbi:hypothetical protein JW960_00775 [candidate division KSB1 bacterium]|nr:hypothetical protein [candidate division KSB1 bacterium]